MPTPGEFILSVDDGRFGKFLLKIKEGYVAKFDPLSAKTDREFMDVLMTSAALMGVSILTSELTPAQRLQLKQLYIDGHLNLCAEVQKKKKAMKELNPKNPAG